MQWHAYKRFFAFLSGNLTPLFLRMQYILNVFKFRSCDIFVIVDLSKAKTWKCLRGKHLTSNTLKTWRDLAMTSAALGRLFDARLLRPPMQAQTKGVQLAKKGQVNNVLPSSKLNETSMLRLQIVVQSTLFPKKKSPSLVKLSKPPPRSVKVGVFWHRPCRTHAGGDLLLSSSAQPCSCRLSSSLSSHLTPDQLVLSNTVLQPSKKAFRQPSRWRGSSAEQQDRSSVRPLHALVRASCIPLVELRASALGVVLIWIRICVSMMVFFFVILVWIRRPRPIFPLFQLALRPASTPDSNRHRSSISPPRNHMSLFVSQSRSALNTH